MKKDAKIYVAGHRGLAGSAIVRQLNEQGYNNIIFRTHAELDLENQSATNAFFETEKPEYVFMAAACVGGLFDNKARPADFIGINLRIQNNVIDAAYKNGVKKFAFLGSSCVYPKIADRKIRESDLLTAPLEPTNEAYAIAKIAGIKMCEFYKKQYGFEAIALMPPNLHGPNDNFDPETSHVMQGIMRRMYDAQNAGDKTFTVWGSGTPLREFMYIDDMADAAIYLMNKNTDDETLFNVGTGEEISILDLAKTIQKVVGFTGELVTDPTKPDGTPRKTMDVTKLFSMGWKPNNTFEEGLKKTWNWYLENKEKFESKKKSA
ncbi:MAG: GDP-fucose synthetase [Magnetococcales bacterium]|nr:GDP-fucose synthetase [Magnetococcales bacterium]